MPKYQPLDLPENPKLAQNIIHFARALRRAGLAVGPGRTLDAVRAVELAGFTQRSDFYWILHACFVRKPSESTVFAQMFRLYWRDPQYLEKMMALLLPMTRGGQQDPDPQAAERRAVEALLDDHAPDLSQPPESDDQIEIEIDAGGTINTQERLRTLDFEQMSVTEMAQARRLLANLHWPVPPHPGRRTEPRAGRLPDWRRSLRLSLRSGGEVIEFATQRKRKQVPDLVVICDISGSMSQYSRAVLHFVHGIANQPAARWGAVHAFTFGTRLTNISRHLATRDVDTALAAAGAEAQDWAGGTRIGACLRDFNRNWARRVLARGAVVLLITDGLDRDEDVKLGNEMKRLRLMSQHLIWLNPLLRWDGFAPKARGIRTMLPHVSSFRAGHNIASLQGLVQALNTPLDDGEKSRMMAVLREAP